VEGAHQEGDEGISELTSNTPLLSGKNRSDKSINQNKSPK